MSWVETQVPCMLYCGPELCNCPAFYFYEALEEDEDWSIADKKELAEKRAYEIYSAKVRDYASNAPQVVGAGQLKATCISLKHETLSALK